MLDRMYSAACCGSGWTGEWLAVGHMGELLSFHAVLLISECERDEASILEMKRLAR